MNHVTDKIQPWLSGELPAAEAAKLEAHLQDCSACFQTAEEGRQLWEALGSLGESPSPVSPSVWPAVREETIAENGSGPWFFGNGRLVQSSLATAALAAGLFLGILLPGGPSDQVGGEAEALAVTEDQLESVWLDDTAWGEGTSDFESAWIGAGLDEVADGSAEGKN